MIIVQTSGQRAQDVQPAALLLAQNFGLLLAQNFGLLLAQNFGLLLDQPGYHGYHGYHAQTVTTKNFGLLPPSTVSGSKGYDFVHFETEEAAMNAKVLDLSTIKFQMKKDQIAEQERLAEQDRHRQGLWPGRTRASNANTA